MFILYIIIIVAFIDTFSQLPIIAPFAQSVGASPLIVGLIIGMYSFSNMLGNMLAGKWIDRIGGKLILVIGMITVSLFLFMYTFVTNPTELLLVRFLHGLGGGLIVPAAFTLLGAKGKERTSGKTMAFSGAAVGIAAIVGPAFGGIISARFDIVWLFYIVATFMLLFGLLAIIGIEKEEKINEKSEKKGSISSIFRNKRLVEAYIAIFSLMLTLGMLTYNLPLKVQELGAETHITGLLLSTFGLVAILFFVLPTNRLFDKKNKSTLLKIGLLIIVSSLLLLSISFDISLAFVAMAVYGVGFAFLFPSASATVIENSKEEERGKSFGFFYAFFSLGVIAGSFLAGAVDITPSILFFISAFIVATIVLVLSIFVNKNRKGS
ncbi:MFS transporter [Bacillus sp. FJAT-45350]|uniref:MFS transporter n=1 Tax=Bacillus sp. FJAT-45350 TaxID=2011014 RepID=UPI000BB92645|nr:MFS transporter [Bacillus sp. FJAT-45350]